MLQLEHRMQLAMAEQLNGTRMHIIATADRLLLVEPTHINADKHVMRNYTRHQQNISLSHSD